MLALSDFELLDVWERGWARPPVERALRLLAAACPDTPDELARLPIGRRDALLVELRTRAFGDELVGLAACPGCGEQVEARFHAGDLPAAPRLPDALTVRVDGYEVRFRLPDSRDLDPLPGDLDAARRQLFERCLLEVRRDGEAADSQALPEEVETAVTARMAACDPLADVELALDCPACEHHWTATFDVVSFLWRELDAWARRQLYEIHVLARAYGWREADVLALGPGRRQVYLEMVG